MRLTFCAACGATEDLQHHHLVTRAEGGSENERNLITLCFGCHLTLRERQRRNERAALAAAARRGPT
jgi:5-methylcytosine-specific restriction endonuclease McrA